MNFPSPLPCVSANGPCRQEEEAKSPLTPGGTTLGSQSSLKHASSLRKRLLESFSEYDAVAKRIANLKTAGPGSSQERVQNAVAKRATLFLQKNLFPLQVSLSIFELLLRNATEFCHCLFIGIA